MRHRDTIHHEIDEAQRALAADLAALQVAVRDEIDPMRNVERVLHVSATAVRGLLSHLWVELAALTREVRHTAERDGLLAALGEVWTALRRVTQRLLGAIRHAATV